MGASLIDTLLVPGALRTAMQPIVDIGHGVPRTVAFECLTRGPAGSNLEPAPVLFDYVRLKHDEPVIDRMCVQTALGRAAFAGSAALSLNVHAATLARDPGFVQFLIEVAAGAGVEPTRLIVEVVEYAPIWNDAVGEAISALRQRGMRIALDDFGTGHSNFRMVLAVQPELFKIDRHFAAGCHADRDRLAVVASICRLARAFDAVTVAEGVEDEADVQPLVECGVDLFQGYLYGRPEVV